MISCYKSNKAFVSLAIRFLLYKPKLLFGTLYEKSQTIRLLKQVALGILFLRDRTQKTRLIKLARIQQVNAIQKILLSRALVKRVLIAFESSHKLAKRPWCEEKAISIDRDDIFLKITAKKLTVLNTKSCEKKKKPVKDGMYSIASNNIINAEGRNKGSTRAAKKPFL